MGLLFVRKGLLIWFCTSLCCLQVFGHQEVSVLDGGLPKWLAENHPVVKDPPPSHTPVKYNAKMRGELVKNLEEVVEALKNKDVQVSQSCCINLVPQYSTTLQCQVNRLLTMKCMWLSVSKKEWYFEEMEGLC